MMTPSLKPERRLPVILHILAWVILLVLPWYLVNALGIGDSRFLRHYYLNTLFYGAFFYINYLVLVPRLYFREKRLRYFGFLILLVGGLTVSMFYLNNAMYTDPRGDENRRPQIEGSRPQEGPRPQEEARQGEGSPPGEGSPRVPGPARRGGPDRHPPVRIIGMITHLSTLIMLTGFSLGLGVLERFRSQEKEKKEMEKEMLNAELALLKNQVSPHFFFNTLNNIYSLIQFDSQKAGETVHKLSKLMRYLLYDSDKNLTGLSEEIQFMKNYIELMELRLNEKVNLRVNLPEDPPLLMIPPLLFIPVVENAFKHGVSYREDSFIEIEMKTKGDELVFRTRNSMVSGNGDKPEEHMGIGLDNVRKRLNLLFPGTHKLRIEPGPHDFQVEIILNTKALHA